MGPIVVGAKSHVQPATRPADRHVWLPDAAALYYRAYGRHREGHTGRGKRLVLVDTGVGAPEYFASRHYRWKGTAQREVGHGTGMAALCFALAPDIELISVTVSELSAGGVDLAALHPDSVLCAWCAPANPALISALEGVLSRVVASPQAPSSALLTAGQPLAIARTVPAAPAFRLPGTTSAWRGHSAAAAAFSAMRLLFPGTAREADLAAQDVLHNLVNVTLYSLERP